MIHYHTQHIQVERYHQSKLANILFSMALHNRLAHSEAFKNFKAVSAAPGLSLTDIKLPPFVRKKWVEDGIALSAPDGACSLLTVLYDPNVTSGDFYEPKRLFNGAPLKVISAGVALSPYFPRWVVGIKDSEICKTALQDKMWNATEVGLGEKFVLGDRTTVIV
eukprot:TRINITY_DN17946_c0_g2_i2.p1 TRINITY_DN17946_c0_g2~~TRINITY_DN17946_c0_g2_i2.p1  ORF type:complete len:164 (-),score=28.05 TRINITY_DN17946_c0_g2_i2:113-604(-)